MALQVELAGGVVAAMAGNAAAVEDRLDASQVFVTGRSCLRIGASNAAGQGKNYRRQQAIPAQSKHGTAHDLYWPVLKASTPASAPSSADGRVLRRVLRPASPQQSATLDVAPRR